jgi:enterochelin esterase-like enzyme
MGVTSCSCARGYVRGVVAAVVAALALTLPGFTPAGTGPDGGQVLRGIFPGTQRPGYVYLPPGFTSMQRYPVAYLLHGMPGSPNEYLFGTGLLQWADDAIAAGRVRPFVAVMPAAGPDDRYNGEWAGPWASEVADVLVPWVDAHLPTIPRPDGRVLAGLSAGGYGAVDIALQHPGVFARVESWSGYFTPLRDGPLKHASRAQLEANDPTLLVRSEAAALRADGVRFFISTGPSHSHWFTAADSFAFAQELRTLHVPVAWHEYANAKGEWRAQLATGLGWAFGLRT